jgi:hypothetical protein
MENGKTMFCKTYTPCTDDDFDKGVSEMPGVKAGKVK